MSKFIQCSKCKERFEVGGEVEAADVKGWICARCAPKGIALELLDFIKERIALTRTEDENYGRFVIRELIQNADDAGASILVLRFEPDSLYVANDGRAFTTSVLGDFDRVSLILKRHQAEDKETTGHFGSGFQTVYALTNSPEVHSSGRSGRMNPVRKEWDYYGTVEINRFVSPYVWKETSRGVIFRFPWRNDKEAREDFGDGRQPFANPHDWPRWSPKGRREMFDDLQGYVHKVLLCCKNLQCIRVVCCEEAQEAYQAERNFGLAEVKPGIRVVTVKQGLGDVPKAWFQWESRGDEVKAAMWTSFQRAGWRWANAARTYPYLLCSGHVTDEKGIHLHVGKKADGQAIVTPMVRELKVELKRNDVHLLFPLFNAQQAPGDGRTAFLYSTIPLPRRGSNFFVFTGHFFPEEGRKDVAVTSLGGVSGQWHRSIVLSVGRLYLEAFPRFLEEVQALDGVGSEEKQRMVLNAVPGVDLSEWMRPGRETESAWADALDDRLVQRIFELPILWTGRSWAAPRVAYWVPKGDGIDSEALQVLRLMGEAAFTEDFVRHPHVAKTFQAVMHRRELDAEAFGRVFSKFLARDGDQEGLRYSQRLKSGIRLGREEVVALIHYCITRQNAWTSARAYPVVPAADGVLRSLSSYKIIPKAFEALRDLLPHSMIIHPDFEKALQGVNREARTMSPDDMVKTISAVAEQDPRRFGELAPQDHVALSRLVVALAEHDDFSLKQAFLECEFIPHLLDDRVRLGRPNSRAEYGGGRVVFTEERAERYDRDFIFAPPGTEVPGLTPEIRAKIRFLDLRGVGADDLSKVNKKLSLKGLQEGPVPTNFLRHFLSDRHDSLFRDDVLAEFLGTKDPKVLEAQKRALLEALRAYYHPEQLERVKGTTRLGKTETFLSPEDMGKVPCLYDINGQWFPARTFAIEMRREIGVLQYRTLHPELATWPKETLLALGVAQRPEAGRIVEVVGHLVPELDRHALADVVALILASEVAWEDKLQELRDVEWVPTLDGRLRRPKAVLVPTARNREIVGPDYPSLFDSAACSDDFRVHLQALLEAEGERRDMVERRVDELGLLMESTLDIMLDLVPRLAKESRQPPPGLFAVLDEAIDELKPRAAGQGSYFHAGAWWESRRILLTDEEGLAEVMGHSYLVLDPLEASGASAYLNHIGARRRPEARDFLERLKESSKDGPKAARPEAALALWTFLERAIGQAEGDLATQGTDAVLYPVEGRYLSIARIVLSDNPRGVFHRSAWYGGWYVFVGADCAHPKALRAVGARTAERLGPQEVRGLLVSLTSAGPRRVDTFLAETVVRLLGRLQELEPAADLGDMAVWPISRGDDLRLGRLSDYYVPDHPAAQYFEGELPLLYDRSDGEAMPRARTLALGQKGVKTVSGSLKEEYLDPGAKEEDVDGTERLGLMVDALRAAFSQSFAARPQTFEWLGRVKVFKVDSLQTRLSIGGLSRKMETSCRRSGNEQVVIYRLGAHPRLYDDLAGLTVAECQARGFGTGDGGSGEAPSTAELEGKVLRLLERDPSEWHHFIGGLSPIQQWLPPMVESDVEYKPGYFRVLRGLKELYGYCQICGRRTPASEFLGDTCERVRSIVSMRGGHYKGEFQQYELANSLFLCPSHHTLFARGLVRLPDIEGAEDQRATAEGLREMAKGWSEAVSGLRVEVFEGSIKDPEPRWTERTLHLEADHARAMLKWLADWLEGGAR